MNQSQPNNFHFSNNIYYANYKYFILGIIVEISIIANRDMLKTKLAQYRNSFIGPTNDLLL